MVKAKLIAVTKPLHSDYGNTPEDLVSYCARVSNAENQQNFDTAEKLLQYCVRNEHWSIFEMVDATMEIKCPRDISRQIVRHRSFSFQEFSQRYSDKVEFCERQPRRQDNKNRQNSIDDLGVDKLQIYEQHEEAVKSAAKSAYEAMIKAGIAKECARVVLPEGLTMSRLFMKGSLRSWIHYLNVREGNGTQQEHVQVAKECRKELLKHFPMVLGVSN